MEALFWRIILWAVRWYCQFALSYRNLVIIMEERGIHVSHTTIMRWVHKYAVEMKKRLKKFLKMTNDSYRVDETYIKVKGKWPYLYRAIDRRKYLGLDVKRNSQPAGCRKVFQ